MKGNSVKIQMIKEYIMKIGILGMLILAGIGFYSCDDITKGYLETGEAGYVRSGLPPIRVAGIRYPINRRRYRG